MKRNPTLFEGLVIALLISLLVTAACCWPGMKILVSWQSTTIAQLPG